MQILDVVKQMTTDDPQKMLNVIILVDFDTRFHEKQEKLLFF
jgi:hypothetical protein